MQPVVTFGAHLFFRRSSGALAGTEGACVVGARCCVFFEANGRKDLATS